MEEWYTKDEIENWLVKKDYPRKLAKEVSVLICDNYNEAFKKGFSMALNTCKNIARANNDLDTLEDIKKL